MTPATAMVAVRKSGSESDGTNRIKRSQNHGRYQASPWSQATPFHHMGLGSRQRCSMLLLLMLLSMIKQSYCSASP
uniref:Uncharacterized protein n=1 Tax=Rhizophora mucronata TaxID=61149 RepID=A0A2P2P5T3_RHIMU